MLGVLPPASEQLSVFILTRMQGTNVIAMNRDSCPSLFSEVCGDKCFVTNGDMYLASGLDLWWYAASITLVMYCMF